MKRCIRTMMISLLTAILTISCGVSTKSEFERIVWKAFPDLSSDDTLYVIIIPNQGCGGCITAAEYFYNEYKNRKDIKFIFTNIVSKKILRQKVEINNLNTYLDTENEVLSAYPQDKAIYPCVIELRANGIKDIFYQSAEENGLSIVENKLVDL